MKIIKQFQDPEYYAARFSYLEPESGEWYWGLGEDGALYCYSTRIIDDDWSEYSEMNDYKPLTIKTMSRIVREFEPLLVML